MVVWLVGGFGVQPIEFGREMLVRRVSWYMGISLEVEMKGIV